MSEKTIGIASEDISFDIYEKNIYMPFVSGAYRPGTEEDRAIAKQFGKESGILVPTNYFDLAPSELPPEVSDWYREMHKKLLLDYSKYEGERHEKFENSDLPVTLWFDGDRKQKEKGLRTGIVHRTMASPDETIEFMISRAIDKMRPQLDQMVDFTKEKIAFVLSSSTVTDYKAGDFPSYNDEDQQTEIVNSILSEQGMTAKEIKVLDEGCAGCTAAVDEAVKILEKNPDIRMVIVATGERLQDIIRRDDLGTTPLFGDGAAVNVLINQDLAEKMDGRGLKLLGSARHLDDSDEAKKMLCNRPELANEENTRGVEMNGGIVFEYATAYMHDLVRALSQELGVAPQHVLAHQANARIVDYIKLKFRSEDGMNMDFPLDMEYGNASSVTVFRLFDKLLQSGEIESYKTGDIVAMVAFGMGLHTNAVMGEVVDFSKRKPSAGYNGIDRRSRFVTCSGELSLLVLILLFSLLSVKVMMCTI
ncbi:hypothetical protein HC823_01050 [Candidatus Gracilibacteria bacterium]|nr:hypothetical protein [Candidatus Gracilibacteria bacterium]